IALPHCVHRACAPHPTRLVRRTAHCMPADLAVIGLGHLGLPLAQAAVAAGIETIGYDTDPRQLAEPAAGRHPADVRPCSPPAFGPSPTRPSSAGSAPPPSAPPPPSAATVPWTSRHSP